MPLPYCPKCGGVMAEIGVSIVDSGDGVKTLKPVPSWWCERCNSVVEGEPPRLDNGHDDVTAPHFRRDVILDD